MKSIIGTVLENSEIFPGINLLEVRAEPVARAVQPGQFCMLRAGNAAVSSDLLLRRPFFVADVDSRRGVCCFVVQARGRVATWLAYQQAGMGIDLWGPLGHGWTLRPEARNLLLIGESALLSGLLLLARRSLGDEMAVTLIHQVDSVEQGYPAALLPPEIEYQVFVGLHEPGKLAAQLDPYLKWADTVCCSVSAPMLATLTGIGARWHEKHYAQALAARPLLCVTGTCLVCQQKTRHGPRLVCRDGPVFALRDLVVNE